MKVKFHIQPGAKKNEIVGMHGDAIKVKLKAPPVDGKANEELVKFLAKELGIARSSVTIVAGATSRSKLIELPDGTILKTS